MWASSSPAETAVKVSADFGCLQGQEDRSKSPGSAFETKTSKGRSQTDINPPLHQHSHQEGREQS